MLDFPFNIFASAEASDVKFGKQLGFANAHHKIPPRRNVGVAWTRELPKIWRFSFNIYAVAKASDFEFGVRLGFAKSHHKKKWV